jgi:hypothetical protein
MKITHDLQSAVSCLTKLSGGNLNNPSHNWGLFNIQISAMTLGQRIEALHNSYYRLYPNRRDQKTSFVVVVIFPVSFSSHFSN